MADKLTRQIALMLQSNERLQQLADEEAWEYFNEEVAAYARGMQALCEFNLSPLAEDARAQLAQLLAQTNVCASGCLSG